MILIRIITPLLVFLFIVDIAWVDYNKYWDELSPLVRSIGVSSIVTFVMLVVWEVVLVKEKPLE